MILTIRNAVVFIFFSLISCTEFDRFERIEDDKLRIIGVTYEPSAEFAPGDTITGKVYFAGDTVVSAGNFSIAYDMQLNKNYFFPDERPVKLLDSTLWFPDSMRFRYVIPADVFLKEKVQGITDTSVIRKIYNLAGLFTVTGKGWLNSLNPDTLDSIMTILDKLYANPSIFLNAESENGTKLKVRSEVVIRYNSMFPQYLPVNNNPQIRWIAVYTVPENKSENFNPAVSRLDSSTKITYLLNEYNPGTVSGIINIDTNYSYFLVCNQGIDTHIDTSGKIIKDTTCDMITFSNPTGTNIFPEEYNYEWFFQNMDDIDKKQDSLLVLIDSVSGSGYTQIKPPVFTEMTHFKIWVVIHDNVSRQYSRPKGYAVRSVEGIFNYTEEYKKSVK